MSETSEPHFELSWNDEGISITEYDLANDDPTVEEEWWYTWTELFVELTGIENHTPDIV